MRQDDYELLYTRETAPERTPGTQPGSYRTKTIRYGEMIDLEVYPLWDTQRDIRAARDAARKSREVQVKLNIANRRKWLRWLVGANFVRGDIFVTLTYDYDSEAAYVLGEGPLVDPERRIPMEDCEAARDLTNYIKRCKRWCKRHGVEDFRWLSVTEIGKEKHPEEPNRLPPRYHHHILMHGIDRDTAERLWAHGRANSRTLKPDRKGLNEIAGYISKSRLFYRQFRHSRGMIQPRITVSDRKITPRRANKIAEDVQRDGRQILEKLYPDYEIADKIEVRYSDYVAGAYIYATLHRRSHGGGL